MDNFWDSKKVYHYSPWRASGTLFRPKSSVKGCADIFLKVFSTAWVLFYTWLFRLLSAICKRKIAESSQNSQVRNKIHIGLLKRLLKAINLRRPNVHGIIGLCSCFLMRLRCIFWPTVEVSICTKANTNGDKGNTVGRSLPLFNFIEIS